MKPFPSLQLPPEPDLPAIAQRSPGMKPFPSLQLPWLSNPRGVQEPSHELSATGTSPLGKEEEVLRQGVLGPPGTLRACLGKLTKVQTRPKG